MVDPPQVAVRRLAAMAHRPARKRSRPDMHRHARRYFRPPPELYERAKEILGAQGSNVNDYLVQCLRRLAGETDEHTARPSGSDEDGPA